MVARDTAWPAGTPCWVDVSVPDTGRARDFYHAVFGWSVIEGPPETGGYSMCEIDGRSVAGIGPQMGPPGTPAVWTTYLATENADATSASIKAAGGQLLAEPSDVMDAGRMAIAADPGGAVFGIWQAGAHTGAQLANAPGALVWNENMSRDIEANKAFYASVFGYEFGDMSSDEFKYATLDLGGRPAGGIGEFGSSVPAQTPAAWSAYFGVDDTEATVARVIAAGGSVLSEPADTPYGRMAMLADDQGAVFSVMSVHPAAPAQ